MLIIRLGEIQKTCGEGSYLLTSSYLEDQGDLGNGFIVGIIRVIIWVIGWVLPPLSNSWIIIIIGLYTALNGTLNIDCYWGGGPVPKS